MATKKTAKKSTKKSVTKKKTVIGLAAGTKASVSALATELEKKYPGLEIDADEIGIEPEAVESFCGRLFDAYETLDGCCGVVEIHGLGFEVLERTDIDPEDYAAVIAVAIRQAIAHSSATVALITTSSKQTFEEGLLPAVGFVPVQKFRNKNSGNEVTIWILNPVSD